MPHHKKPRKRPTIEDLYPELPPEKQREAEENLRAYIELVVRIVERIRREPGGERLLASLTEEEEIRSIDYGSNINNGISDEIV